MATNYSTYAFSASQSPVSSYKRNNHQVTEGYDLTTARYWFRLDFGQVREFSSRSEMEAALEGELTPKLQLPDLSLPQLPAHIPHRLSQAHRKALHRKLAEVRSWGTVLPTGGVICLPAPKPADLASEIQAVVAGKKAWFSGETVWIANRSAFLKESGGFISLDYLPPNRKKLTPPVPAGKVGLLSATGGWMLGREWMNAVKKAEQGLGAA